MLFTSLAKISRFTNDAAGLEKSLRFLQSLVQVIAAYSASAVAARPWLQARRQFALGRRYLRFFKFIDAFSLAFKSTKASTGITAVLEAGKWSCLGMYLLLESFTIMDTMGIWSTEWAPRLFIEAMKFWFYSISFSIILSLTMLYSTSLKSTASSSKKIARSSREVSREGFDGKAKCNSSLRWNLAKKLSVDFCDLFIPGSTTGWLAVSSGTVGILSMVSTVLASFDIWKRVQRAQNGDF